jgi:FMN reductase
MADSNTVLMLVGAATPPGRLAAAIDFAAGAACAENGGITVDILNLADTAIDICDGRALDAYGEATRRAVARIAGAGAVLIGAPVYRASYPGVLKNLLDIAPVEALQNKPVGILAMGGSPHH